MMLVYFKYFFFIVLSLNGFNMALAENKTIDDFYELESREVDLDRLITTSKMSQKGQRFIMKPKLIRFSATIQDKPKEAKADYLINALAMMGMADIPATNHQMFIRSDNDAIISVYVEDDLARMISENLKIEQKWIWYAIHSYNYYRGPALLITRVEPLDKETAKDSVVKNHD